VEVELLIQTTFGESITLHSFLIKFTFVKCGFN